MSFFDSRMRADEATELGSVPTYDSQVIAPYSFKVWPARKLVCLTISGFWNEATIEGFAAGLHRAVTELGCGPGEHALCCDVSRAAIQPQEILKGFQNLIVNGPTRARKLALWTSNPLSRMQARRLIGVRDNVAVFGNAEEAMRWLEG